MDVDALRTICIQRWKWNRRKAMKLSQSFLDILQKKYPEGPEDANAYYVLPGFEHVTKFQPIGIFNPTELVWELSNTTLFIQQK